MAYEAYVSLVVIPEEARHRAPWDSQRPANGTTYTQNTSGVSRDDLFLSGVVSVLLWASIWLAVRERYRGCQMPTSRCSVGI